MTMSSDNEKNSREAAVSPGNTDYVSPQDAGILPSDGNSSDMGNSVSRKKREKMTLEAFNALHRIKIPKYTLGEELTNAISHGIGGLLSIAALVLCVVRGVIHQSAWSVVSGAVYGSSLIILYTMSTLYHSLAVNRAKLVFRVIGHCSIFLLIAGTYTPYTLISLRSENPALAWTLFGAVWAAAIVGITLSAIDLTRFNRICQLMYLVSGWAVVVAFVPMTRAIETGGIVLLVLGGALYTVGAIFYAVGKKRAFMHSVFHLFVVAGSILHFFSIFLYVL